jgi:hypothetical protein
LIATSRRDDRVHPGHARKMAAKLQAMGYEAWFYEPAAGGHGYGKDNAERAAFTALGYNFLHRSIGSEGKGNVISVAANSGPLWRGLQPDKDICERLGSPFQLPLNTVKFAVWMLDALGPNCASAQ